MSDRENIEKAAYLRRMYEEKLAHVNPKKSFKDRVNEALSDMDKKFGPKWRDMIDKSGLDIMPSSESNENAPESEDLYEDLKDEADEEGIGGPPDIFRSGKKPQKSAQEKQQIPLIVVIEKRIGDVKRKRPAIRKD
jgi:hypothetical protein